MDRAIRQLENKWATTPYPKYLNSLELKNIRGWSGQKIEFKFPIVAIVGENGMGKSTIIQAAAAIYKASSGGHGFFASTFFPDTAWEEFSGVEINANITEGLNTHDISIRKPTTRWRGNDSRHERPVRFIDLRRIIPIYSKLGYSKLAKRTAREQTHKEFDQASLQRLSAIIGKPYTLAKQATTNIDSTRLVPVLKTNGNEYSGFHQGAGELSITELLALDIPKYSLVLIDEIETSLHPSAQRRLIRDIAEISRTKEVQFIITTHSPYILEELPKKARIQIINDLGSKRIVAGVSTEFALSCMDDILHTELDIYVEDDNAKILLEEIIAMQDLSLLKRVRIITYGSAQVGKSLGQMVSQDRFPNPVLVYLDGDQEVSQGCLLLPLADAPERQIYSDLDKIEWPDVASNLSRSHADLVDAAKKIMTTPLHHEWNRSVADKIVCGGLDLWRAMCKSWVKNVFSEQNNTSIIDEIKGKLN